MEERKSDPFAKFLIRTLNSTLFFCKKKRNDDNDSKNAGRILLGHTMDENVAPPHRGREKVKNIFTDQGATIVFSR